jgi:hypothetical protein
MKNKKRVVWGVNLILVILLIGIVSASFCCEETVAGALCQQIEEESECDTEANSVPTSCEATSYCQLGTCIDGSEGICMPNTPESACTDEGGFWDERDWQEIPQCQLGCCLMGEQAAFVTQVRCEVLSSNYGLTTDYKNNIQDELTCLASASPSVRGACVYEENYAKKCLMTTKKECQDSSYTDKKFHEGFLCSAPSLATICGPRGGTTCAGEKDEVYFLDTCGNLANIYDYSLINDDNDYWTYIQGPSASCTNTAAKKSATCGACDYYAGSTCDAKKVGESVSYGDYICKDLDCSSYTNEAEGFSGNSYPLHGEIWCAAARGVDIISITEVEGITTLSGSEDSTINNLPGSKYFLKKCFNGEVTVEVCADYRQEVCVETELTDEGFKYAVCRKHMWEDCFLQITKADCIDIEQRDCQWMNTGYYFSENGLLETNASLEDPEGICVPLYSPGFDIKSSESTKNGQDVCPLAKSTCVVTYDVGILKSDKIKDISSLPDNEKIIYCTENCHCIKGYTKTYAETLKDLTSFKKYKYKTCMGFLTSEENPQGGMFLDNWKICGESEDYKKYDSYDNWISSMNNMCVSMGDCGNTLNLIGKEGIITEVVVVDAAELTEEEEEEE